MIYSQRSQQIFDPAEDEERFRAELMDGPTASRLNLLGDPTRWKPIARAFLVTNEWLKLDQRTLFVERELGEALKRTDLLEGFCPQDFRWRWNALITTPSRLSNIEAERLIKVVYQE